MCSSMSGGLVFIILFPYYFYDKCQNVDIYIFRDLWMVYSVLNLLKLLLNIMFTYFIVDGVLFHSDSL